MKLARRLDRRAALRNRRRSAIKEQIRRGLLAERLEERSLLAGDVFQSEYWNASQPLDVTDDTYVAPNDALAVINYLNAYGAYELPEGLFGAEGENGINMYLDVNNDGFLTPADALDVINFLNAEGAPPDGVDDFVEYDVRLLQAGTNNPISSVQGGQDFDLAIFVQDLRTDRTDPTGVFSAYMDLFYDKNLSTVRVAEIQSIQLTGTNEIQTITRGTDASLQFSYNGVSSTGTPLTWNSAILANTVQTKLRTIPALGTNGANVAVAGPAGGPFTVTFLGNLGSSNVPFEIVPSVAAAATVATTQQGGGDTFTLTINGNTTPNIPFRTPAGAGSDVVLAANATAIQNALNTMLAPQFGPNTVQVDLIGGTNYSVWFNGEYDVNFNKMVAAVTGGAAAAVTVKDASDNTPTVPGTFINVDGDKTIKDTVAPFRDSFAEAFRTRTISVGGVVTATPGEFQKDLDARDEADHIGEVGAFAESFNPLGAGTFFEVVRVRMMAILPTGQTMVTQVFNPFLGNPATYPNDGLERPAHNTLTYANPGESTLVLPEFIAFNENIELLITSGPITAANFSVNVDENALNVPINVLANVTDNPGDPANPVIELVPGSVVKVSGSGTVTQNGNNVTFSTSGDLTDSTVFTYTARVQGDTDPNRFATATATININAINDAPDITGPGAQNVQEGVANTTINFGATAFNVTDVDVATGDMTLTLTEASAANSQITLGTTTNLLVTGNGSNSVTATGKIADINNALDTVQYVNISQTGGNFSLVASISDLGNTGNGGTLTDSVTVAINITSVNDAPTLTAPGNVAVAFVDTLTFNGPNAITVADVDSNNLTVTLAVSGGVGTLAAAGVGGAIVTGSGSTNLTITGSPTAITNTLAGMVLTPPPGNTDVLTGAIAVSASDGVAPAATANIVVNVIPPNLPFAINDTPQGLVEGSASYTVDVLVNDLTNDPTNRDPILVSFTQPMRGGVQVGTVTLDPGPTGAASDDKLVFNVPLLSGNPDLNFFTPPGQDITFTYVMNEGPTSGGVDATATVTIRIANQADAPVATNDDYATTVNTPLTISDVNDGVLRRGTDDSTIDNNYGDSNFATLTVLIDASNPATRTTSQGGSVTINPNGTFVYTPQTGDIGNDTFTYQAVSSAGGSPSAPATVTIKIASPPIATNDSFTVLEQGNPAVSGNVLTGGPGTADDDTDPTEMQTLTAVNLVQSASTADGTVTLNPNGDFSYTPEPNENFFGTITFTYQAQATDGRLSNVATVTLTVQEVNDAPTAANDTFTAVRQQSGIGIDQPVAVLGNDSFAPDVGETLTVTGISTSVNGPFVTTATPTGAGSGASVRVSNGQVLYTSPTQIPPNSDVFFYQISDGRGGNAVARVDVSIVDFVPKTISGSVYIDEDNDGVFDAGELPLAGVTVLLSGSAFDNQQVSLTAVTDQQGRYVFPQKPNEPGVVDTAVFLKPPSAAGYTITEIDPFGFLSGIDSNTTGNSLITNASATDNIFVARWPVADNSGNITGLNFGETGIDFRPVSEGGTLTNAGGFKHEFLSSSGGNGFVLALDGSGNLMWNWTLDDPTTVSVAWENAKSISAVLSADLTTLTLTVRDGQNQTFTRVLTQGYSIPGSTARFRILGTGVGGQLIIRVDASANGAGDGLGMTLLAAAPAAMAGAEGEAPVNADYANSADAVYAEGAWA